MPRYNKNLFYEAAVIAYLDEQLKAGISPANRAMINDLGFASATIVNTVRNLVASQRLKAHRDHRGKLFVYEVKVPPTEMERQMLEFQRKMVADNG